MSRMFARSIAPFVVLFSLVSWTAASARAGEESTSATGNSKVDFSSVLTNAYGEPYLVTAGEPMTLGRLCVNALDAGFDADRNEDVRRKYARSGLAIRIVEAERSKTPMALGADDAAMLRERIEKGSANASLVAGAVRLLDPAAAPAAARPSPARP